MIKKIMLLLFLLSLTGFVVFTGIAAFASSTNAGDFNRENLIVGCVSDSKYEQTSHEFLRADDNIFHYPIDSLEIQEIVKSFETKDAEDMLDIVDKINNYVKHALEPLGEETGAGVLESLKLGKGDCDDYARLFVTLARAADIPSRVQFNSKHMWAEVLVPMSDGNYKYYKWIVVDPTDSYSEISYSYSLSFDMELDCENYIVEDEIWTLE